MTLPAKRVSKPDLALARTLRTAAILSLAAALCGCAVGPDFQRPRAPNTESFTGAPLPPKTAASEGPAGAAQTFINGAGIPEQWWLLFHCEKLDALVAQALKSSPDVVAAQSALRQAHENMLAQQGSLYQSLDANGAASRQKISGASFGQPAIGSSIYNLFNATVNVS